jgi:hypothetical protein
MKIILSLSLLFLATGVFAQTQTESELLNLSKDIFHWEVEGKFDSLATRFGDQLVIVSSTGNMRTKNEYLADLRSGKPVHKSIEIQQASTIINGTTGIVNGKGIFVVSINNTQATFNLSYMEVFVKDQLGWKLIALHTSRLAN